MDNVSPFERSAVMRAVKSHGNRATELALLRMLRQERITGWRRRRKLKGSPDFVFSEQKIACFVDGCFWHGCPEHCRMPKGNRSYWDRKIASNKTRDRLVDRVLREKGWCVMRIWEHELKTGSGDCVRRIRAALTRKGWKGA